MWEVLRKTRVCDDDPNSAADFALPFHNDVGPDPSFEEMKKVVCIDNRRPEFLDSWRKSQFALNMWQLMESCWHENPSVRLPSLRIKKNLAKFKQSDFGHHYMSYHFFARVLLKIQRTSHDGHLGISHQNLPGVRNVSTLWLINKHHMMVCFMYFFN